MEKKNKQTERHTITYTYDKPEICERKPDGLVAFILFKCRQSVDILLALD